MKQIRRFSAGFALVLLGLLLSLAFVTQPMPAAAEPQLPEPSRWPVAGKPRVLQKFDPPAQRWFSGHRGVDLAAGVGDQVLAAAAGTVTFAGDLAGRGVVTVDHGQVRTTYEPVTAAVAVGARVYLGQIIGVLQQGSHCSQPCLHWGLLNGKTYLDPLLLAAGSEIRLLPQTARASARKLAAIRIATVATRPGANGFRAPVPGVITSRFGMRFHPVLKVWKLHDGTDYAAACGTEIRAPYPGRVRKAYFNAGYGNRLMLDHGIVKGGTADGRQVVTGYNHAINYTVSVDQQVKQGQVIGHVGTTGFSTGCHLHLMVWLNGGLVDPLTLF